MTRFGKLPVLVLLIALAALVAALFGALLPQLSYSVGPSHFEALVFPQAGIDPGESPRFAATQAGLRAAWWIGPLVTLPAFLFGFASVPRTETYLAAGLGAIGLVFVLATFAALIGLVAGIAADATGLIDPFITVPEGPARSDFLRTGFMHDGAYVAAGLGLLVAFWPMVRARRIDNARLGGAA